MAYNGSGVYNLVMDWVADAAAGIKIRADRHMTQDTDFKNALSNVVCRDGQSTITADMPWNAKRITNLGDPVNAGDALNKQWAQANLVSGAYVPDTQPAAAQAGNLWWDSDQGGLYLKYNDGTSTQWVQVNVGTTTTDAPQDGNEYVRVNGTWRLKEQRLALAGQTTVNIPVPAWATVVNITATQYLPIATGMYLYVSGDGTTFPTTGYYINGPTNVTTPPSFNTQATAPQNAIIITAASNSVTGVPGLATYTMNLQRTSTADYFACGGMNKYWASSGNYITTWYTQLAGEGMSQLRLAALRISTATATPFGADAQCILRWS